MSYSTGEFIKRLRKQHGITQEMLANKAGISKGNLSKIERGAQQPSLHVQNSLLEALGVDATIIPCNLSNDAYDFFSKCRLFSHLVFEGKQDEAEHLLQEISENQSIEKTTASRRFVIWANVLLLKIKKEDSEIIRPLIIEGLSVSIKDFDETKVKTYLLSYDDIQLLNMLATTYEEDGNLDRAIDLLTGVKENLEGLKVNAQIKTKAYVLILTTLTNYLSKAERYQEAIDLSDYTSLWCIDTNNMLLLPHILYTKAYALNKIGNTQQCKRLLYQSYCGYDMMGQYEKRNKIKELALKNFGIRIDAE